jgi:Spy/CpxP family protein refolding chaperone
MKRINLFPMLVALSLLLAATLQSVAQGQGGGRGQGGVLTQEQRTQMRDAMQASRSDLAPLTEKLAAAQKEAVKAALAKDADEKTVRAKLDAVAKIQTDMALLRMKAIKEVAGSLTEEQKTQLLERPAVGYSSLFGGGMGGAMGGGAGAGARRSGGGNQ